GDEAVEQLRRAGFLQRRAGGLKAALDHPPRAAADERARLAERQRRQAFLRQQHVERADQVGRGVDQGAVEVEGDGGAFQGGSWFRHALALTAAARGRKRFSRAARRLGKPRRFTG